MSSRRITPPCDRRQLPWGMTGMDSPTGELRPMRLPFLEADQIILKGVLFNRGYVMKIKPNPFTFLKFSKIAKLE
ncbi:hypothetical protein Chor_004163 [Crotalus horridus]